MLVRLALALGVIALAVASGANNLSHTKAYGWEIVILVGAAELLKLVLPLAMLVFAKSHQPARWIAALFMWALIVVFSAVNTFGNVITVHATKKANMQEARQNHTSRQEHVILRDISNVATCNATVVGKGKNRVTFPPDEQCVENRKNKIAAFQSELQKAKETPVAGAKVDAFAVEDGYVMTAALFGWYPNRNQIAIYMLLLWVALCEIGSALGGFCIPERKKQ
jgi:hypothetical protein